jgi:hypothetical protein
MRLKPMVSAFVSLLVVWSTAMLAAPEQTLQPGQMTQAHVWVQNRGRGEAVPVDLRESNLENPLRVRIVNGEPNQVDPIIVRMVVPRWDYRSVTLTPGQDMVPALSGLGVGGWETTGIVFTSAEGTTVLLKRPR